MKAKNLKKAVLASAVVAPALLSSIKMISALAMLFPASLALAANECAPVGVGPADNPGADIYSCTNATYTSGVTYSSSGELTVGATVDAVEFGGNGIQLTGNGADNVTFSTEVEIEGRNLMGALLDISTQSGNITVLTEEVDANAHNANGMTHGIRALSASGNINIMTTGVVDAASSSQNTPLTGRQSGIEAVTSANIDIVTGARSTGREVGVIAQSTGSGDVNLNLQGATGSRYGIRTSTIGDGAINLVLGASVSTGTGTTTTGIAGIEAIAQSGDILMQLNAGVSAGGSATAVGVLAETDGHLAIAINEGLVSGGASISMVDRTAIRASAGSATLSLTSAGAAASGDPRQVRAVELLRGGLDLAGVSGEVLIDLGANARWNLLADSYLGAGNSTLKIATGSIFNTLENSSPAGSASSPTVAEDIKTLDFGSGENQVLNSGAFIVSYDRAGSAQQGGVDQGRVFMQNSRRLEGELRLLNLDRFENSGDIYLGAAAPSGDNFTVLLAGSDRWYDDILVMQGADYVGNPGSRLFLDALYNNTGQTRCDSADRNADGDLAAVDCIDLRGGSVTGRTEVVVYDVLPGDRGAYNIDGNVIVDVSGGEAVLGGFVVSPESEGYSASGGGVIDKGLFAYTIGYDAEDQQYKLYGIQSAASQQFPMLAQAANELWRTSLGSWFDRQTGQRGSLDANSATGGVWVRAASTSADRDVLTPIAGGSEIFTFDNTYTQYNTTLSIGRDWILSESDASRWIVGPMVGYARGRVDFDAAPNSSNLEGMHAGFYSSYSAGGLYVDAAVNGTWVVLRSDIPALDLQPSGAILDGNVESFGGQLEAGWRLSLGAVNVQPLASVSYVTTQMESIRVPADDPARFGGEVAFDDPQSLRTSLGVRVGMDNLIPSFTPVDFSLTARAIQESEGVASAVIRNVGETAAPVEDSFDGTFGQINGALTVANERRTAIGYLNVESMFGDDYTSLGFSAGFRYQW